MHRQRRNEEHTTLARFASWRVESRAQEGSFASLAGVRCSRTINPLPLYRVLRDYYCHEQFSLHCQISVCDFKTEIAPLRYAPAGDSFGFNTMTVVASSDAPQIENPSRKEIDYVQNRGNRTGEGD